MSVTIDLIENAQLDHGVEGSTLLRVAYVSGLDAGFNAGDPSMLFRALFTAGIPQWYEIHPSGPGYACNRHVITPMSDSTAKVLIYYVRGRGQPPAATWIVTESSTPIQTTTQIHPGTGEQIIVQWTDPKDSKTVTQDIATFSYPLTLTKVTFSGWVSRASIPGPTPQGNANTDVYTSAVNSVNLDTWRGHTAGFWLFNEWDDTTQDNGFSYTIRASMCTKGVEDWSQYQGIRDTHTGKYYQVDPNDILTLKGSTYTYDVTKKNGITKVGLFPMVSFGLLFGQQ